MDIFGYVHVLVYHIVELLGIGCQIGFRFLWVYRPQ